MSKIVGSALLQPARRVCVYSLQVFMQAVQQAHSQWRRQLVGTWARAPLAFDKFSFARLYVVWFGLVLQPYWNNTITGYNGACAKVKVVFTARCYALVRSCCWLVSVRHVRVLYPDG